MNNKMNPPQNEGLDQESLHKEWAEETEKGVDVEKNTAERHIPIRKNILDFFIGLIIPIGSMAAVAFILYLIGGEGGLLGFVYLGIIPLLLMNTVAGIVLAGRTKRRYIGIGMLSIWGLIYALPLILKVGRGLLSL